MDHLHSFACVPSVKRARGVCVCVAGMQSDTALTYGVCCLMSVCVEMRGLRGLLYRFFPADLAQASLLADRLQPQYCQTCRFGLD